MKILIMLLVAAALLISGCASEIPQDTSAVPGPVVIENNSAAPAPAPPARKLVSWEYSDSQGKWISRGIAPDCPELVFESPIDIGKATSVLYPGQYRPDYKPHGGFRFDNEQNNSIEVRAPFDGYVWRANRRFASGQLQYNIEIINECGINHRLDHLLELAPEFAAIAEKLPQPVDGDSRVTWVDPYFVKKGTLVATKVGVAGNVFMDWGAYDFRKENEAAKNQTYREKFAGMPWNAFYALCWLNYLPEPDKTLAKSLPGADGVSGKTSDYC